MLSYDAGRIEGTFYGLFSVSTTITLGGGGNNATTKYLTRYPAQDLQQGPV